MKSTVVISKIESFFAQYRTRHYAEGQILILNGDSAEHVYQIVKGAVKQYDVTYRGDEIILNIFKPPAFFPMSLAINGGTSDYIYEAETDIDVRQVPTSQAVEFVKENPEVLFDLLSRVYKGTDALLGRIVQLTSGNARTRLIFELLTEARRFGKTQQNGSSFLSINEKDLAARSGLSRETVSREMHKLKEESLVSIDRKGIIINDTDALRQKITPQPRNLEV